MLMELLRRYVGQNAAPFAGIALFVGVVGVSLWLTPRIAKWIDARRNKESGFFDGMLEQPPENDEKES